MHRGGAQAATTVAAPGGGLEARVPVEGSMEWAVHEEGVLRKGRGLSVEGKEVILGSLPWLGEFTFLASAARLVFVLVTRRTLVHRLLCTRSCLKCRHDDWGACFLLVKLPATR